MCTVSMWPEADVQAKTSLEQMDEKLNIFFEGKRRKIRRMRYFVSLAS